MEQNIFTPEQSLKIVDTVLSGHNDYLNLRIDMKNKMAVSTGFAWTKANFIDDAFSKGKESGTLDFIQGVELAKAGESWEYLEFQSSDGLGKSLLIVKNLVRLKQAFEKRSSRKQSQYLLDYAEKSKNYIKQNIGKIEGFVEQISFDFAPNEAKRSAEIQEDEFDNFFVIAYSTDANKQINEIQIVVLDAESQTVIPVQNLTDFIQKSKVEQVSSPILSEFEEAPVDVENLEGFGFLPNKVEGEEIV